MKDYSPSSLPPVTAVEVVLLSGVDDPPRVTGYMSAAGATSVLIGGMAATQIADLWRRLPPGDTARCHTPPFGLRFLVGGEVICQGSICWQCNNIYGDAGGEPFFYEFDAEGEVSRSLLAQLQRIATTAAEAEPSAAPDRGGT